MKQYITMQKTVNFDMYRSLKAGDHRFSNIWQVLSDDFNPGELIEWFSDDEETIDGNEYVDIRKETGKVLSLFMMYQMVLMKKFIFLLILILQNDLK